MILFMMSGYAIHRARPMLIVFQIVMPASIVVFGFSFQGYKISNSQFKKEQDKLCKIYGKEIATDN